MNNDVDMEIAGGMKWIDYLDNCENTTTIRIKTYNTSMYSDVLDGILATEVP